MKKSLIISLLILFSINLITAQYYGDFSIGGFFDSIGEETQIMIGDDNLFSDSCGAIFTRCRFEKNSSAGLIGILGPIRMDYDRNLALINYTRELFDN